MTIDKVIAAILNGGAGRLTIPGLGTFIKRGGTNGEGLSDAAYHGGTLVFMSILSGDDGVLTAAVARAFGEPETAAKARVEKYAAGLRAGLKEKRSASIEGVGTLLLTESGKYKLIPADKAERVESTNKAERVEPTNKTGKTEAAEKTDTPLDGVAAVVRKPVADEAKPVPNAVKPVADPVEPGPDAVKPVADDRKPVAEKHGVAEKVESHNVAAKIETTVGVSKTAAADTNTIPRDVIPDGGPVVNKPKIRHTQKRKRLDPVIIIAIIAIAIGIIVLLYGRTVERDYTIDLDDIINTK